MMSLYCNYSCVTHAQKKLSFRVRVATKGLPTGWEAMVRLWLFQLAHTINNDNIPPNLAVRGNQIDIMLVPVEKRTYASLGAKLGYCGFGCLMVYILSLPLVIRL